MSFVNFGSPKNKNDFIRKKIYFFFALVILIFVIDHLFKLFVKKSSCFLIFCLKYTTNSGAAFSLFQGFSWTRALLIIVALIVLILSAFFYFKIKQDKNKSKKNKLLKIALPLLFAGTISNMLDRAVLGYVIDYLNLAHLSFLTFNIADLANVTGVVLLIIYLARK
jgi:signal peptidase II